MRLSVHLQQQSQKQHFAVASWLFPSDRLTTRKLTNFARMKRKETRALPHSFRHLAPPPLGQLLETMKSRNQEVREAAESLLCSRHHGHHPNLTN